MGVATSDTSFSFSWSDSNTVSQYVIEWGPTGFTQGTGISYDTVSGTSWSIDTLLSNTTYDLYIQSICLSQGMNSPWYGPVRVTTPCAPLSAPWTDGFESAPGYSGNSTNPNLPSCWAYDGTYGTSYSMGYGYSYYANTGSYSLYNYMYSNSGDTNVVSTPLIENLEDGGYELAFYARTSSTNYPGGFDVVLTDIEGTMESARLVKRINLAGNTTYQQYQVYLDSNVVEKGDMRVGFRLYSKVNTYDYVYIDDVEIDEISTCTNYNHEVTNISSSGCQVNWSYTGTNCFNIEYGPVDFVQGTGIGTSITNASVPYSITNLNQNTTYDYYVQNCCTNQWEGPFTFTTECSGPLNGGVYTVGTTGSFETIDSALTVLNNCGISGPVTLQLLSGYHVPSVELGSISGSSASNSVTIKGTAATSDTLRNLVLNGTSHLTLSDLAIKTTGGFAIRLNGTSHITISGNSIISPQSSSTSVIGIVASKSATSYSSATEGESYLTIENNVIEGGYFGINLYGSSGTLGANNNITISDNDIIRAHYYGLYVYYARDLEIVDNRITDFLSASNYGAYLYYLDGVLVSRNEFDSYNSLMAYYFSNSSESTIQSEISNNMFYGGYTGMRVYYGSNLKVYHNSTVGSYYGLYDYYNGSDVDIRNNIFQGGIYPLYSYYSSASRDYNLYYGSGSNIAYVSGSNAADLTALQGFDSNKDQNSLSGDPIFVSTTDLHVTGILAHNSGDDSATVSVDFDGETRPSGFNSKPDIGADEFEIYTNQNFTAALDTSICFGDSITLSTVYSGSTSSLWTSGEASQSITVAAISDSAVYTIQTSSDSVRFEQFIIRAYDLPEAYLSATGTLNKCEEDSVDVSAYGTNGSYLWSNSATTATITTGIQGSYWFTVTDSNACSSLSDTLDLIDYNQISSGLIWNNPDTLLGSAVALLNQDTVETCFGIPVSLSSTSDAVTTYWNTGDSSSTLIVNQTGDYFATTWSSNGCMSNTDTTFIEVKAQLPDSILTTSLVQRCIGESANLSIGIGSGLSYTWNTGDTANQITVSSNGDYFATITNDFGCSVSTDTVEFLNYANPSDSIWAGSITTFCSGDSVTLMVSTNTTFAWNTGDSTQNISIGSSGSYWAQVTDSNGCSVQTDTVAVTANPLPVEVITNTGSSMYCDGDSTALTLTGQNTYQWSTGSTADEITVFTSGDYFAMLTDSNGCQNYSDTVAITVNALPSDSLVISGTTEFCQGDSVIVAALTNASFIWSTGDTTQQVVVSSTSAITGMVTDANGCMRQLDTALITVNPLPNDSIYAVGPTTFCLGDSVLILSADAGAIHLWNTLDTSSSIVAYSSGAYYVGLVTNKGCIGTSDTIDLVANPNPNASIAVNGSLDLCPGDSVELSANPGLTYSWTSGDSTQAITVGQTGNFSVDITNGFGCTSTSALQNVIVHPFPQTSVILGDTSGIVPLQQYTYVVTQTPGNTYNWTSINGAVISGQGTNIATVMWSQDTLGSLQVVESNGYCTDTSSLAIRTNIGVNEFGLRNITLFPNPTQGKVSISADEPLGDIKVYAATGALITSKRTTETSLQFDFSTLSAGVYWITIGTERYRLVVMN
ncbi:MAG: right-handed parallel beta-helix repeat-containing protein [Schleiferiaceae bacterium]|nr:right-handed parallel beta-helix repeat-containing protein [Schleiferiaceae bacterium]